jgi:hypothetical protein
MNYAPALLPFIIIGAILPALAVSTYPKADLLRNLQSLLDALPIILAVTHHIGASLVKDTTAYDRLYNLKADLPRLRCVVFTTGVASLTLFQCLRFNT